MNLKNIGILKLKFFFYQMDKTKVKKKIEILNYNKLQMIMAVKSINFGLWDRVRTLKKNLQNLWLISLKIKELKIVEWFQLQKIKQLKKK